MHNSKFKETEIGIREDWETYLVSEAIYINPKRELKKGSQAKYISMADIEPYTKKVSNFINRKFSSGAKFQNGDTLLARITPCLENGKTAFVDVLEVGEVGWGSTEFIVLCGKEGKTDEQFVYYLARSPNFRNIAIKSMSGTSGRQRVQEDILSYAEILIPPLPEQHAIAKILSDLDAKIELNHQMNVTLEKMAGALFKHWFVDFEFPNEHGKPYKSSGGKMIESELGEIPEGWKVQTMNDVVTVKGGSTPGTENPEYWKGGQINWCTPKDLSRLNFPVLLETERKITEKGLSIISSGLLPAGTLLLSSRAPIGYLAISEIPTSINQGFIAIICDKALSSYYLLFWIKRNLSQIKAKAHGTTFEEINKASFRGISILTPSLELLEEYNNMIEKLYSQMVINEKESQSLSKIRDSLLPRLMSGKIRVPLEAQT